MGEGCGSLPAGREGGCPGAVAVGVAKRKGIQLEIPQSRGGGRALVGIAMSPATRRGQHRSRKWQSHRELGWRTTGQRFGILCNDQPKESRQHWGIEPAQRALAGATTQVPHRE